MQTTKHTRRTSRSVVASVLAVALALSSSAAIASAMNVDEEGEEAGKAEACAFIGCRDGNRECGKATGKISSGMPPFVGEIKVSWTCYEGGLAK
jgi:uncharacterized membrane protein